MHEVRPNVTLLEHTPDPEDVIAKAARLCYADVRSCSDLFEREKLSNAHMLKILIGNGHTSPFEHASFTFGIDGISRACSHQLVRHRLASYSQQSQRYVKAHDNLSVIVPETVKNNVATMAVFESSIKKIENAYAQLIEFGIEAEDARYLLPNATQTHIVVTMNARELLGFFHLRCCNRAQWEIRDVAWQMLGLVKPLAPHVFDMAGPGCIQGRCPEGTMSCGHPYQKED